MSPRSALTVQLATQETFDGPNMSVTCLLQQDTGKPLHVVKHADVPFAISLLEYYAGWADGKIYGETVIASALCDDNI
jgi:acyl-CoA reductase-like NAD-dependent aldehyde dehydrogenase